MTLEPLVTIPQAARMIGKSRSAFMRSILALHAQDVNDRAPADWLVVRTVRQRRVIRLNLSRLRAAHPGHFSKRWVDPQDYAARLEETEKRIHALESRVKAHGSEIRELKSRVFARAG
jgi:hypothetical protein